MGNEKSVGVAAAVVPGCVPPGCSGGPPGSALSLGHGVPHGPHEPLGAGDVAGWQVALEEVSVDVADAQRVDLIAALERLKSAAAAVQARLAAAMAEEHVARAVGRDAQARAVRSVAGQVGLARRVSPARRHSLVGLARALSAELPSTLDALAAGRISEWQAILVARETAVLSPADRRDVDSQLAPRLGQLGDRGVAQEARRCADRIDPEAAARRVKEAEADRRVTVRPAPGAAGCAMARLTATMPVAQAVAAYAGLRKHAQSARSAGDSRGIGELMSDELFARLTATSARAAAGGPGSPGGIGSVNVEVGLVMTERSLLRGGQDQAVLTDEEGRAFAQVPASLARRLVRDADHVWLSRLYANPHDGALVAMDAKRRTFTGRLRRLLVWRDQTCRTPWCEAPVRHADHVRAHELGGATGLANGAGLCEACNYLKEAEGWRAEVIPGRPGQVIEITTPTGHRYRSQPPPAPGHQPRTLDAHVEHLVQDRDDGVHGAA